MKLDINYQNISFEDLTETLINSDPQERSSIPLSFDSDNLKDMHEALVMFFTKCMKKKFGDKLGRVNLLNLNNHDFSYIDKYFQSISIKLNYKFYDLENYDKMYTENFLNRDHNNLQDYRFKLKIENKIFILWFQVI